MRRVLIFLALLLPAAFLTSVPAEESELTLELAMSDPDWIGNAPENPYWADDGLSIYYLQKRPGEEVRDWVQLELASSITRTLTPAELGHADSPRGDLSPDRRQKVYEREGDLFVKELETATLRQLTRTPTRETDPRFLADGRRIVFSRGNDLFVRELDSGLETLVAELRLEKDPAEKEKTKPFDYLAEQQQRLIGFVREGREKAEAARERELAARAADPTRLAPPYYLGEGVEIRQTSLSPNGRYLLVVLGKKDESPGKADQMPNYVTASGYVESREVRAKVGTGDGATEQLVWIDLERREQTELSLGALPFIQDDPLRELREKAEAARKAAREAKEEGAAEGAPSMLESEDLPLEETPPAAPEPEAEVTPLAAAVEAAGEATPAVAAAPAQPAPETKPRPVIFRQPEWNLTSGRVAIQAFSVDNKDRWILTVDAEKKAVVTLHHLRDLAWLGWDFDEFGWLPGKDLLWYLSEESGFGHLYLADLGPLASGGEVGRRQLTAGEFGVSDVVASRDGGRLTFRANREHPGIYEVYRVEVESGELSQITRLGGLNTNFRLSPDERQLLVLHSTTTVPPEVYTQANEPGATARRLTQTVSPRFAGMTWLAPEIVAVPSNHTSRPIYSRLYLPPTAALPEETRPAVFFIHGAGYLQNSHQGWSTYFREFMFHNLLARRGYVVLDMDYRASEGYGRDWRTAIYRQMGTPELEDLADGIEYLVANHGVDRARIGVYGGSYGGFLTMMALFKRPELFAAGAALRPVTDWAHYNHGYTSSILNTPMVDPEAYEKSSPIEFADGLEKPLLICAPMQDDNVFFQDTVRLAQKLIELEKENWEVAIYPIEPHGFRVPSSWLDEYRRIWKLMETHVRP